MTLSIKHLLDNKSGEEALFYPITHERAVIDSNNTTLETKLVTISDRTEGLNNTVSAQSILISSALAEINTVLTRVNTLQTRVNTLIEDGLIITTLAGSSVSIGQQVNTNWPWINN